VTTKQRINLIRRARRSLHAASGYKPEGGHYKAVDAALDALELDLKKEMAPAKPKPWANVGPIQPGGISLLDMSLTHKTSGIPLFPAVDTAWGAMGGVTIIAPEGCVVDTKDTGASPGEAVYLTLDCGLRLWIGHLNRDWPLGKRFKKGDVIGATIPIAGTSDHAHVGVNGEAFLGKGKQFKYGATGNGPDYTLGAPTIRQQLEGR
jgi:hypothetical protein